MGLATRASIFRDGDDTFPWECDDEDGDYRFYEWSYGAKVFLNFHYKRFYPSGVVQCEGVFLNGYKAGVWRFFNGNGVLSQFGSYNQKNERYGKWRFCEELNGKAALKMVVDQRESWERYWSFDMDGRLWQITKWLNIKAELENQIVVEEFFEPSHRKWPETH